MAALVNRLVPILILCTTLAAAQSEQHFTLSKYTQTQLMACDSDLKLCGATSIYEIDGEFRRRLPKLSSATLLHCFADWHICGLADGAASGWPVSDELARRGHIPRLLATYGDTPNSAMRDGLEHVAYHFHSPQARKFMRQVFMKRLDDGEDLYWPTKYLAKQCDQNALEYLSHHSFSISSFELSTSTVLFGKCHYRPAIPFLVGYGLYAASLNLVDASDSSLRKIYPNVPKFSSLEDEQHWFCHKAHRDGYQADCEEVGLSAPVSPTP